MPLALDPEEQGLAMPTQVDGRMWVIICPDCGDIGGPPDKLPETVRKLRGPYPSIEAARRVASAHQLSAGPAPEK
jgi:hypothetical protein